MWFKNFIEVAFSLSLFINALLFIPQILKLLKAKNSEEVSFLTFGGFWLIQLFMTLHGLIKGDVLLVIGCAFSLMSCGAVVFLMVLYRFKKKYTGKL